MAILKGYVFYDNGNPVVGATVDRYASTEAAPTVSLGSTTTDANGMWTFTGLAAGRYDVRIDWDTPTRRRWRKGLATDMVDEVLVTVLRINDTSRDHHYTIGVAELTADRILNLPLLTGTDTVAVLALAQTFLTGVKTFNSSILAIRNPADTFSYTVVGGAILAARNITLPVLGGNDVFTFNDATQVLTNKSLTAPAITGGTAIELTGLSIRSTGAAFDLLLATDTVFTGTDKTLTIRPGDANRILTFTADASIGGTNTGDQTITLTGEVTGTGTGSFAATVATTHSGSTHANLPAGAQVNAVNIVTVSGAQTLTSKTLTSPIVGTQITLDQTTADYTLTWADPAAARAISIPDPLGTDVFVFRDMSQTLINKTLTSPVVNTQLTGTAVGAGASQVAAGNHTHAASGALTRAGGNTTEATTTSLTTVDLLTVSSLSIGVATPFKMVASVRKTTGAAGQAQFGFKYNTTEVILAASGWNSMAIGPSAGNAAASGIYIVEVAAHDATYLRTGRGHVISGGDGTTSIAGTGLETNLPNATATDLIITALSPNAAVTVGADDAHVYTYAVS